MRSGIQEPEPLVFAAAGPENPDTAKSRRASPGPQATTPQPSRPKDAIQAAMDELGKACAERAVEPICSAYQALCQAAMGMRVKDIFDRIEQALGAEASGLIVSAFSHRHCFMCIAGMLPCDQCKGSGLAEPERACPHCDGLGITECSFCRGTGWADHATVPRELHKAVLQRHLAHVRKELDRLRADLAQGGPIGPKMPADRRRRLGAWLMRLQARLEELLGIPESVVDNERESLADAQVEVEALLRRLAGESVSPEQGA